MKNKIFCFLTSCLLISNLASCSFNREHTVTFDSKGGSEVASQKIKNGEKATKPADPTKENSLFINWFKEEAYENSYDFSSAVTSDLTLFAKWKTLTNLDAKTCLSPAKFSVGYKFNRVDLQVDATFDNGSSMKTLNEEYSVSPSLPYTFKNEDISSGKDFTVTYLGMSKTVHVDVQPPIITLEKHSTENYYFANNVKIESSSTYIIKANVTSDCPVTNISFYNVESPDVEISVFDVAQEIINAKKDDVVLPNCQPVGRGKLTFFFDYIQSRTPPYQALYGEISVEIKAKDSNIPNLNIKLN